MRWLRTYPDPLPQVHERRSYVVDMHIPAHPVRGFDTSDLASYDDDILLCEWDIVFSPEDMERFAAHAAEHPGDVLAAPYRLYTLPEGPVWAHVRIGAAGEIERVADNEEWCDYFGFGMTYLPREIIRGFVDADPLTRTRNPWGHAADPPDVRMTDWTLSLWHRHTLGRRARIDWSVRPVHLHW